MMNTDTEQAPEKQIDLNFKLKKYRWAAPDGTAHPGIFI